MGGGAPALGGEKRKSELVERFARPQISPGLYRTVLYPTLLHLLLLSRPNVLHQLACSCYYNIFFLLLDSTSRWSTCIFSSCQPLSPWGYTVAYFLTFQRYTSRTSASDHIVIRLPTFIFCAFQRVSFGLLFRLESYVILVFFLFLLLWCLRQLSDGESMSLYVIFHLRGLEFATLSRRHVVADQSVLLMDKL